jgi:hypothetical protein
MTSCMFCRIEKYTFSKRKPVTTDHDTLSVTNQRTAALNVTNGVVASPLHDRNAVTNWRPSTCPVALIRSNGQFYPPGVLNWAPQVCVERKLWQHLGYLHLGHVWNRWESQRCVRTREVG